jgi:hypothetical protein
MGFEKLLRDFEVLLKNDPYCMRPVEAVIRTAGDPPSRCFGEAQDSGLAPSP